MNRSVRQRRGGLWVAFLLASGPLLVAATTAPAVAEETARVRVFASGIDIAPTVEFGRATLVVRGDGQRVRRDFAAGDDISIDAFVFGKEPLADGVYRWELGLGPTREQAAALMIAASKGDGSGPAPMPRLAGSFTIQGGFFAADSEAEPTPRPTAPRPGLRAAAGSGAEPAADRVAGVDSDQAFVAGAELRQRLDSAAAAVALRSAAAPADSPPDSDAVAGPGPAVRAQPAPTGAAALRPPKQATPDNQGRPEGATPNQEPIRE